MGPASGHCPAGPGRGGAMTGIRQFRNRPQLEWQSSIAYLVGMAKKLSAISEQVRQAIKDSGMSRYRISQLAQIDESHLAKFFNGTSALGQDALDRLGRVLNLRIVSEPEPTKNPKGKQ